MRLGVLDVGSNTVHLQVVDTHLGARPVPTFNYKEELRLTEYLQGDNTISREGINALEGTLRRAIKEAEKQEPVAWYDMEHGEANTIWSKQKPTWEGEWRPLYTSPPQRQPLTDEQIEVEWERITGHSIIDSYRTKGRTMFLSPSEVFEFARAIEAAHGIKE